MSTHPTTAARRSSVVHGIDLQTASFTLCGRRIGDDWQGEYSEAPAGPITCKTCLPKVPAPVAPSFTPGQRVGIVTGLQSVSGPWVNRYGTVVGPFNGWQGSDDYVVREDDGTEDMVFAGYLLRPLDDDALASDDVVANVTPIPDGYVAVGGSWAGTYEPVVPADQRAEALRLRDMADGWEAEEAGDDDASLALLARIREGNVVAWRDTRGRAVGRARANLRRAEGYRLGGDLYNARVFLAIARGFRMMALDASRALSAVEA